MKEYKFPHLSPKEAALLADLLRADDWASRIVPSSQSRKELRKLLIDNDLLVVSMLRRWSLKRKKTLAIVDATPVGLLQQALDLYAATDNVPSEIADDVEDLRDKLLGLLG